MLHTRIFAGRSSPLSRSSSSSSAVGVYPIVAPRYGCRRPAWLMAKQLKLGLDLKGGVHLVLRVQTDDALRLETEQDRRAAARGAADRGRHGRRDQRRRRRRTFRVEGVPPDAGRRSSAQRRRADGHELRPQSPGAGGTYDVHDEAEHRSATCATERSMQARQTIERRVNELGVTEPSIAQQGDDGDQILVQLPGVTDVDARQGDHPLDRPARAEARRAGPGADARSAAAAHSGQVPADMEVVPGAAGAPATRRRRSTTWCARSAAVTGSDLRSARPSLDENNRPAVSFTLNTEGARKFGKVTGENIGRHLAIVLDGRVQSAPRIEWPDHRPTGGSPAASRRKKSQNLVADPALGRAAGVADLPARSARSVRRSAPTRSAPASSRRSSASLLVVVFMLVYYKLSGVNAIVALVVQPDHPARPDGLHRRGR